MTTLFVWGAKEQTACAGAAGATESRRNAGSTEATECAGYFEVMSIRLSSAVRSMSLL